MTEREERKSVMDERRYAIFSKDSIKLMSEEAGFEEIHDTVAGILGEDVSYRLREMTQKSAQFMRHCKRKRMNTEDFNKACRFSDIPPVHGHNSTEPAPVFQEVKSDLGEVIHYTEDPMVQLAAVSLNEHLPKYIGETTIKAHWLAVEGVQKTSQNPQGTPGNKVEANGPLMKYFDKITQAVLSSDAEMMKTALTDIRTNGKITPLVSHFVSFVVNGVKTLASDLRQLTKLLYLVRALVCNSSLFLEASPFLSQLTQSVQFCLLEPLTSTSTSTDHWAVRDYAARLLSQIVSCWGNQVNQLERFTEKALRETLHDLTRPFVSHYGAVMALLYLGPESIERVLLPHLVTYLPHLFASMEYQGPQYVGLQRDSQRVHGAIMLCVEHLLKKHVKDFKDEVLIASSATSSSSSKMADTMKAITTHQDKMCKPRSTSNGVVSLFHKSPVSLYLEMSEHFGDSLTLKLPEIPELKSQVFTRAVREVPTAISDPTADKSGEELLEELMETVKQETRVKTEHGRRVPKIKKEPDTGAKDVKIRPEAHPPLFANIAGYKPSAPARKKPANTATPTTSFGADMEMDIIDVEGDTDRPDLTHLMGTFDTHQTGAYGVPGPSGIGTTTQGQGIKMTFAKKQKLPLSTSAFSDSGAVSDFTDIKEKESGQSRKRKQSSVSPDRSVDELFEDIADFQMSSFFTSDFGGDLSVYSSPSKYRKKE